MLSSQIKPTVVKAITPIARLALKIGLTPNLVSAIGAVGVIASALYFYPKGDFLQGTLVITFFVFSDLFDGTMARLSNSMGTSWGAFLDSTLDRITDSAILIGVAIFFHSQSSPFLYLVLCALLVGFLIPYIRAKAEALGIECSIGIAERTERLILMLVGIGLDGLGVPYILPISLWLFVILGTFTVWQRVNLVRSSLK